MLHAFPRTLAGALALAAVISTTPVVAQSATPAPAAAPALSPETIAAMAKERQRLSGQMQKGQKMVTEGNAIVTKSSQRQRDNAARIAKLQRDIDALQRESDGQNARIAKGNQLITDGQAMQAAAQASFSAKFPGQSLN